MAEIILNVQDKAGPHHRYILALVNFDFINLPRFLLLVKNFAGRNSLVRNSFTEFYRIHIKADSRVSQV